MRYYVLEKNRLSYEIRFSNPQSKNLKDIPYATGLSEEEAISKCKKLNEMLYPTPPVKKGAKEDIASKAVTQEIYDLCCEHGTTYLKKYLKEKYGVGK